MKYKYMCEVYSSMMDSCYKENCITYHSFGAKGIKVCPEWHDREKFYEWCRKNNWLTGMRVVRKDKDKDFSPENCFLEYQNVKKAPKIVPKDLAYAAFGDKLTKHPIYHIYQGMKQRCYNPKSHEYCTYGERGIKICPEWLGKYGAIKFIIWSLENGWEDGLTIDRMNNDLGYSPDNCRWTDDTTQAKNRRNVILHEYKGKMMNLSEISEEEGIKKGQLYELVNQKNIDVYEAIKVIKQRDKELEEKRLESIRLGIERKQKIYEINPNEDIYFLIGKINYQAVGRKYGVPPYSVKKLVDNGMDLMEAIETVKSKMPSG